MIMPEDFEEVKDSLEVTDTETDNKLCEDINKDSRNLDNFHPIRESSEEAQNASTDEEPNAPENLPSAEIEPYLDSGSGNAAAGKPSTKVTQQRRATMADVVGAALLVVVSCALKTHVKAVVVVGIVGLA